MLVIAQKGYLRVILRLLLRILCHLIFLRRWYRWIIPILILS